MVGGKKKRKKASKVCSPAPTGDQAGLQDGQALLHQPSAVGALPVQPLLQPVVHLPARRRPPGQVQEPRHAAGLQRAAEDEDHRGGGAGRGECLCFYYSFFFRNIKGDF